MGWLKLGFSILEKCCLCQDDLLLCLEWVGRIEVGLGGFIHCVGTETSDSMCIPQDNERTLKSCQGVLTSLWMIT